MEMSETSTDPSGGEWIKGFSCVFLLTRSVAVNRALTTRTMRSPAGGAQTQWRRDPFSLFVSIWLICICVICIICICNTYVKCSGAKIVKCLSLFRR